MEALAEKIDGGAAAVQIVCKKLQEEKCVAIMKVVAKLLGTDTYLNKS